MLILTQTKIIWVKKIYFEKSEKGLGTNPTNAKAIAAIHGKDYEGWVGKKIVIYPTQCQMAGKTVDCIRVKRAK